MEAEAEVEMEMDMEVELKVKKGGKDVNSNHRQAEKVSFFSSRAISLGWSKLSRTHQRRSAL